MTATIILPVKPFDEAKTRLSPALSPARREALSRHFFQHVLGVASAMRGLARCMVVSRSVEVLDLARQAKALPVEEAGTGLNAALMQAMCVVARGDKGAILTLSTDLPLLTPDDLAAMLIQDHDIAIAPDHIGQGTNALFMARPSLIPLYFGAGSYRAHRDAAAQAGLRCITIMRAGLARDIDSPDDLQRSETHHTPRWGYAWPPAYDVMEQEPITSRP
jgi:2-phospho-L-lactate guanylyltransferase